MTGTLTPGAVDRMQTQNGLLESSSMRDLRAQSRLTSWIAALAILLASLAPALSHALASPTSKNWIEICTTQGSQWIQASADGSDRTPASAHVLEHCPCA